MKKPLANSGWKWIKFIDWLMFLGIDTRVANVSTKSLQQADILVGALSIYNKI